MKLHIDVVEDLKEDEVTIRCARLDTSIQKIQQFILDQSSSPSGFVFYKEDEEFYFPVDDVLFFETNAEKVYAHTAEDIFFIKSRLYELETILPASFVRISKSAILNMKHIYSIRRNLTAASLVRFHNSHKQVYVSRSYYKNLKEKLDERSFI